MRTILNNNTGETLLEAVMALSVLAIGIMLASTIMGTSIRNMNGSKNRVIGVNIAKEGLEAVHNIRDTNWLKYSGKKRECWNHDPAYLDCQDSTRPIEPGDYIIYKQLTSTPPDPPEWDWQLQPLEGSGIQEINGKGNFPAADASKGQMARDTTEGKTYLSDGLQWVDLTQIYNVDIDPLVDSDGDHNYTDDKDAFNHVLPPEKNALGYDPVNKVENGVPTVFRRQINIQYLDDDGKALVYPKPADSSYHRMRITSTVTWQEGKNEFKTDLVTDLSDYLERENLD
jgi:hypothetical protein